MTTIEEYFSELQLTIHKMPAEAIQTVVDVLYEARMTDHQVLIMGNGGSAATASHFVCDLAKNTRQPNLPNFRVIGLTDNVPILTALANDEGYEAIFTGQIGNLVRPGDVVIAISASGNSPNVLRGIELANELEATTIGFTGFSGGALAQLVDLNLHVPSQVIEHVEDIHLMLEHVVCKGLRALLPEEVQVIIKE